MSSILEAAHRYTALGWSLVVLEPGQKKPLAGRPWTRAQRERAPLDEILSLLEAHPGAGLGLVTGAVSGAAVVDLDDPAAVLPVRVPAGPVVESATEGHSHHYFDAPRPVPTVMGLFGQKIELRGERAMTVLPPSEVNGRIYTWRGDPAQGLPPLPAEILRAAQAATKRMPMAQVLRGVLEGQRNIAAARVAGFFLHRSPTAEEAWASAVAWNGRNVPPMESGELRGVFESILARHRRWVGRRSPDQEVLGPMEEWVLRLLARVGTSRLWQVHRAMGGAVTREELEGIMRTMARLGRVKVAGLTRRGAVGYCVAPVTVPSPDTPRREAPEPPDTSTPVDCSTLHTPGIRNDKAKPGSDHSTQLHTPEWAGRGRWDPAGVVATPAAAPEGKVEREVTAAPVPPSMRLTHGSLPDGTVVVSRCLGTRWPPDALVPMFRGTLAEWLAWTPPEILRDESRMAEWPRVGEVAGTPVPDIEQVWTRTSTGQLIVSERGRDGVLRVVGWSIQEEEEALAGKGDR